LEGAFDSSAVAWGYGVCGHAVAIQRCALAANMWLE
jgi:hypothetical protein